MGAITKDYLYTYMVSRQHKRNINSTRSRGERGTSVTIAVKRPSHDWNDVVCIFHLNVYFLCDVDVIRN